MNKKLTLQMLAHSTAAAVIFFVFQYFVVGASLEMSALWSLTGAVCASYLAWRHHQQGR